MENPAAGFRGEEEQIVLPPGFRFHPTDEELISHYLSYKALDVKFTAIAIGEADLNKCEPWDLPQMAKMGETEWYFFSLRDRKYPTGLRTNRATGAGYWKATGKDKEIYKGRTTVVGMKKTLVFYKGRAPKGEKSNWIMHEYRLFPSHNLPSAKNEWVICRVFHKTPSGEKKFPLLNQTSTYIDQTTNFTGGNSPYVRSFSRPMNPVQIQNTYQTIPNFFYPDTEAPYPVYQSEINPFAPNPNPQYPFAVYPENNMYMGPGLENNAGGGGGGTTEPKQGVAVSMSQDTAAISNGPNPETSSVVSSFEMGGTQPDEGPSGSMGPDDFDSFWDF